MAAQYLGRFTRYVPTPNPYPTAVHMQNEKGVDLYEARDRMGPGLFFTTENVGAPITGASVFPFVVIPKEGDMVWFERAYTQSGSEPEFIGMAVTVSGELVALADTTPLSVSKTDIWNRLTTDEAASAYADIQDAPAAFRGMYDSRTDFEVGSDALATLQALFVNRFGTARAAQILAP